MGFFSQLLFDSHILLSMLKWVFAGDYNSSKVGVVVVVEDKFHNWITLSILAEILYIGSE